MHVLPSAVLSLLALSSVASVSASGLHGADRKHWSRKHASVAAASRSHRGNSSSNNREDRRAPIVIPASFPNVGQADGDNAFTAKREMQRAAAEQGPKRRAAKCKARTAAAASPTASTKAKASTTSSQQAATSSSQPAAAATSPVQETSTSVEAAAPTTSSKAAAAPTTSSKAAAAPTTSSKAAAAPTTSSKAAAAPTTSSSAVAAQTSSSAAPAAESTTAVSTSSFLRGWSSSSSSSSSALANALFFTPLATVDLATALKAEKGKAGPIGNAPDGTQAMIATYPAGQVGGSSAWSYYSNYQPSVLQDATEAVLGYSVYFPADFEWVKGGKLPGLFGGEPGQYGCSGGEQSRRNLCWSARLMWRADGAGEVYTYLPETDGNSAACDASGKGAYCKDATYGLSFGRKNFYWKAGEWNSVQERVKLNTVGQSDGSITLTVNGVDAVTAFNLEIRTSETSGFNGIFMSTFFGGSDASTWSPSSEQKTYFSDFSLGVLA